MNTQEHDRDDWQPCTPGRLQAIGAQRKARRRTFRIARSAAAASVLVAVIVAGIWKSQSLRTDQQYFYGGISCEEVRTQMDKYAMGALPDDVAVRIKAHLQECLKCQKMMRQMQQSQSSVVQGDVSNPGAPWELVCELCVIAHEHERSTTGIESQLASIDR